MSSDSNTGKPFDLNFFENLKRSNYDNGYLICHKCYGYYPLKENESPDDFLECECGSNLEFYEDIDDFIKIKDSKDLNSDNSGTANGNYDELQEIENALKSKSEKRKKFFEDLSMRIKMQEDILTEINYGEKGLWDTLEEKSLDEGIIETAAANMAVQENNFLSHVKKQRSRAERAESHYFTKISATLFIMTAFVLLFLYLTT
jgi:hypothetical protein